MMITCADLTKIYPGAKIPAVDAISLQVEQGDVFGFLGPNGAGKTTTVKMLVGLIRATSGTIRLLGASPQEFPQKQRIGFLPEHPYFYQYLTAREFLEMCAQVFRIPQKRIPQRIRKVLEQVQLIPEAWDRKIGLYSKGMQQRLGLAQALINDPELVILDEPMSGLDPLGRSEVKKVILDLRKSGKTVFLNSHILADVEDLCNRVAIIDQGQIICEGSIEKVTKKRSQPLEKVFVDVIHKNRSQKSEVRNQITDIK